MQPVFRHFVTVVIATVVVADVPTDAQHVDLTLDLYYGSPTDSGVTGYWELSALATDRGLSAAVVRLRDVFDPMFFAPSGLSQLAGVVGFHEIIDGEATSFAFDRGDHLELVFAQYPVLSPGPQGLFYDVGVPGGAIQPGELETPSIVGLDTTTNVPWGFDDRLGDLRDADPLNDNGEMQGGVLLAAGKFLQDAPPRFYADDDVSTANVFLSVGSTEQFGEAARANVTTRVRDNSILAIGDANFDGVVDEADFQVWSENRFTFQLGWKYGDFNADGAVDVSDFNLWNANRSRADRVSQVPEPGVWSPWLVFLNLRISRNGNPKRK